MAGSTTNQEDNPLQRNTFVPLFPPHLIIGSKDSCSNGPVRWLQEFLFAAGYAVEGMIADGNYGDKTAEAVQAMQRDLGFEEGDAHGNCGPRTRERMVEILGIDVNKIPMGDRTGEAVAFIHPDHADPQHWPA